MCRGRRAALGRGLIFTLCREHGNELLEIYKDRAWHLVLLPRAPFYLFRTNVQPRVPELLNKTHHVVRTMTSASNYGL